MDKILVYLMTIAVLSSSAFGVVSAAPDGYPDSGPCEEGQDVSNPEGVYNGTLNSPDDYDNVLTTYLKDGEYLRIRVSVPSEVGEFDLTVTRPGGEDEESTSVTDIKNGYRETENGASLLVENGGEDAYATFFAEKSGNVCLNIDDNKPDDAGIPYEWTIEITKNKQLDKSTTTVTTTADTTTTVATTADTTTTVTTTDSSRDSTTSSTEDGSSSESDVQDSDGDGVIDSKDYAPGDPDVQEESDLQGSSGGLGLVFGVGIAVIALLVAAFVVYRRS